MSCQFAPPARPLAQTVAAGEYDGEFNFISAAREEENPNAKTQKR
jgi:hypothetical protein